MFKSKVIKTIMTVTLFLSVLIFTTGLNVSGSEIDRSVHPSRPVTVVLMGKPPYKISGKHGIGFLSKHLVQAVHSDSKSEIKKLKHEVHHLEHLEHQFII